MKLMRTVFVGLCATTATIVACSHNQNTAQPPLGQSQAQGPANNDAPPPDAPPPLKPADVGEGVPGAAIVHHASTRVAQVTPPANPTNPTQPNRPPAGGSNTTPGTGSGRPVPGPGSGSNRPVPGPGSGSGSGQPVPGQPRPTPPGTPTPGQPVPTPPVTQPVR